MAEREADALAVAAAAMAEDRVGRARAVGAQMSLFGRPSPPAEDEDEAEDTARRGPGRPAGSRNKVKTKLRELMAAQGYRDPASQLAAIAGLNVPGEDPFLVAIGRAEALLAAAGVLKRDELPDLVTRILREMRQAADSLMPYVFAKLTPDQVDARQQMFVQMVAPGAASRLEARVGPPPLPSEQIEEDQGVKDGAGGMSDSGQSDATAKDMKQKGKS